MKFRLTIRVRLTLLYFAVLALSFLAFFWICDIGFRHSIETTVNASSRTNLEIIKRLVSDKAAEGDDAVAGELTDLARLWASGALFQVADSDGHWLYRSKQFLNEHPPLPNAPPHGMLFVTTNLDFDQYRVALERTDHAAKASRYTRRFLPSLSTKRSTGFESSKKKPCRSSSWLRRCLATG